MKTINELHMDKVGSIVNGETLYGVYINHPKSTHSSKHGSDSVEEILIGEYDKATAVRMLRLANKNHSA